MLVAIPVRVAGPFRCELRGQGDHVAPWSVDAIVSNLFGPPPVRRKVLALDCGGVVHSVFASAFLVLKGVLGRLGPTSPTCRRPQAVGFQRVLRRCAARRYRGWSDSHWHSACLEWLRWYRTNYESTGDASDEKFRALWSFCASFCPLAWRLFLVPLSFKQPCTHVWTRCENPPA